MEFKSPVSGTCLELRGDAWLLRVEDLESMDVGGTRIECRTGWGSRTSHLFPLQDLPNSHHHNNAHSIIKNQKQNQGKQEEEAFYTFIWSPISHSALLLSAFWHLIYSTWQWALQECPLYPGFPTPLLGKEGEYTMKVLCSKQFESKTLEIPFRIASKFIKYLGINL